jgi:hypothetical protein
MSRLAPQSATMAPRPVDAQPREGRSGAGRPSRALALVYGVLLWGAATILFALAGNSLVPDELSTTAWLALIGWVLCVALVVGVLAAGFRHRTGLVGSGAGLEFGATVAAVGLVLDGVLVFASGLEFPGLETARLGAITAYMLLAYALIIIIPWVGGSREESR